jgi:hypothetical protein
LYGGTCTPNSPNPKLPGIVISRLSGRWLPVAGLRIKLS